MGGKKKKKGGGKKKKKEKGSAIYGLVHAEIAKKAEQKTQVDLQSYYDSLNQIKAPNLGSLGANVLDGTQIQSSFTNF